MTTSLNFLKANDCAKISDISGGCGIKKRLYEIGLHKGADFKVIKNDFGPVILSLSGHKLALGRGLAASVIVER